MTAAIPPLNDPNRDPDGHFRITLRTLEVDFGVDVSGAAGLSGAALHDWIDDAEDALFKSEMSSYRSRLGVMSDLIDAADAALLESGIVTPDCPSAASVTQEQKDLIAPGIRALHVLAETDPAAFEAIFSPPFDSAAPPDRPR